MSNAHIEALLLKVRILKIKLKKKSLVIFLLDKKKKKASLPHLILTKLA